MAFGGETADSYYDEGITASMRGEVDVAIECFEKAIRMNNKLSAAYHQLGKCYLRRGDAKRAQALLKQVVQKRPDQTPAQLDYALALLRSGMLEEARQQYTQVAALKPDDTRALIGLAQVAFEGGDFDRAAGLAENAIQLGGANFAALLLKGKAARLTGDLNGSNAALERAEKVVEKSIELNPSKPEGHYLRAETCFAQERFHAALEHFREAEDRTHKDRFYSAYGYNFTYLDIWIRQGLCYQRLGEMEQARKLGERVLEKDPQRALAIALAKLGRE